MPMGFDIIPPMANDSQKAARKFREFWLLAKDSEVGGYQKFWLSLISDVLGVDDALSRIGFQLPVRMRNTTKYLDAWIPETKVLIEHKARGIRLDAPQSGHGGKTPFEQALEYNQARGYSDKARWIVISNFDEIWVYDMDKPLAEPHKIRLGDLPKEVARLGFLVDSSVKSVREQEKEISIQAGRIVGELYKALLGRYADPNSPETLKALNRLCVRLVFLFYAEDADLFPKDAFWNLLKNTPSNFLRRRLIDLFGVLDTPEEGRDAYLDPELAAFPYTNGGLFKGAEESEMPAFDDEIRELLVKSSNFDWREISPTIFGALFESTLNPETRRAGGMVYTSVENIHKVIDPLFLGELTRRVDEATKATEGTKGALSAKTRSSLMSLQSRMASLKFLDPACGSGNFLTETFLSLRRLENRIIAALQQGQGELDLGLSAKVSLSQFLGIEINDFAVAVAKTAMWIAEAQMLQETAKILRREPDYLPLKDYDGVVEGNALRMDWPQADYIMGNPPFVGQQYRTREQAADMEAVFGKDWKGFGNLDYVTAWYKKAAAFDALCAFVSTNSICQGDGVAALWKPLFAQGLEIDFAWRTFRWDSEAIEKAHVHCVIVGFRAKKGTKGTDGHPKTIFDGDRVISAAHINGYLMDAPDAWVKSRSKPLCDVPAMTKGSSPVDGGNLLVEKEDLHRFANVPQLTRRFVGAYEFLHNEDRFCLWLVGASPATIHMSASVMERIRACQQFRLASTKAATRKYAEQPTRFMEIRQPDTNYIIFPRHSSENRRYIPLGYMEPDVICGDANLMLPSATLYHFGVLTSSVHMAWMRAVAGRLKSDYRYSANIVYNNFPWPGKGTKETEGTEGTSLSSLVTQTAQAILDTRARYPEASLADLYDPLTMPPDLRGAHEANDRAVLTAYGLKPDTPEPEIVAHLFRLYEKATEGADRSPKSRTSKGGANG